MTDKTDPESNLNEFEQGHAVPVNQESDKGNGSPKEQPPRSADLKSSTAFWLFLPFIVVGIGLFVLGFVYPQTVSILLNSLSVLLIVIFGIFIIMGIFVILGLRKEAASFITLIFEGSVKYIDFVKALSSLWESFKRVVEEIVLILSPLVAVFLGVLFYYLVMYMFRVVSKFTDVTLFTIAVTVALACITALLGIYRAKEQPEGTFQYRFSKLFGRTFVDAIEISVLVLFLTLDMRNPFFLPKDLHVPIEASMWNIDFMERGTHMDTLRITIVIAGAAILVEIIRKIYRIGVAAFHRYHQYKKIATNKGWQVNTSGRILTIVKPALQQAFRDNLDDFTKFLGFTTILVIAFFFFPKLKLLSLLCFNLTNFVWDLAYPQRVLRKASGEDVMSRIVSKVFGL